MKKHTEALCIYLQQKRSKVNKWSYCIAFQTHLFRISWEWGNGVKTTYIMLIQTSETKIYDVLCFMLKKWIACLLAHWDLIFAKLFLLLKHPLFLAVLGADCQKRRLHTDLTLIEHSSSLNQQRDETWIPWPKRAVPDMQAEMLVSI